MFARFFPLKFEWIVFWAILTASFIWRGFCSFNYFKVFLTVAVNNFLLRLFNFPFIILSEFFLYICLCSFKPNPNFTLALIAFVTNHALAHSLRSLSLDLTRYQAFYANIWSTWCLFTICFVSTNYLLYIWLRSACYLLTICFISAHDLIYTWSRSALCFVSISFDFEYAIAESNKCIPLVPLANSFETLYQAHKTDNQVDGIQQIINLFIKLILVSCSSNLYHLY